MRLQTEIKMGFRSRRQQFGFHRGCSNPVSQIQTVSHNPSAAAPRKPEGHLLPGGSTYAAALVRSKPWRAVGEGRGGSNTSSLQTQGPLRVSDLCGTSVCLVRLS